MRLNNSFTLRTASLVVTLAFSPFAHAGLVASTTGNATVQGSPYAPVANQNGVTSLVLPTPAGNTSNASFTSGAATVTFGGDATVVKTAIPNYAAAPVTGSSGSTASPFLSTNSTSYSATAYNSAGQTSTGGTVTAGGAYTLTFSTAQAYLGLLWGSIGTGDLLTFYSGSSVVGTVNGTTAAAAGINYNASNGAQNFGGSQYELINFLNGGNFTSVVFSQTNSAAFESSTIQYAANNVSAVPEPGSVMLLGIGVAGLVASRRRKAARV